MHEDKGRLPPRPIQNLFDLGQTVATPAALDLLQQLGRNPVEFVARHHKGDWGDIDDEDRNANERALNSGGRLFSSYNLGDGGREKLWVITEWDRSYTTVLLPSDY